MKIEFINFFPVEKRTFVYPMLGIPIVAALTPDDIEIQMSELQKGESFIVKDVDVIAMSVLTHLAPYVYDISIKYRERGKKVILGGPHPSALPNEALLYCDSVVIGEAEPVWNAVIKDLKKNNLQRIYKSDNYISMDLVPISRVELMDSKKYTTRAVLHASRGCPYNCSFCSITTFFGNTYRFRSISKVIEEIQKLVNKERTLTRSVIFNDDNIACNRKYSKELFHEIKNLNITWSSQANLNIADDPELLNLAAESGCIALFIGIESINSANLKNINKPINEVNKYEEDIKRIHDAGIVIMGSFILGLDRDDERIVDKTLAFVEKNDIDIPIFNVPTPFPGTRLYEELDQQGRILVKDWSKYDLKNVICQPKLMSPETLQENADFAFLSTTSRTAKGNKKIARLSIERRLLNLE